jgi:ketosteroid isomerase-like protein
MNKIQQEITTMNLEKKIEHFLTTTKTDFVAALDLLSEDVVWINRLPTHVPFGGEYHGRDGVAQYFQKMLEVFVLGEHKLDEYEFIETEDTLVIVGCEKGGTALPTGKVFDLAFVWVVRFDDQGRIKYLREHNDTAAIGDAFQS